MNDAWLTDKVRFGATKVGLENISRSALTEITYGVIEMFQNATAELIEISRKQRSMTFITNNKKIHSKEGSIVSAYYYFTL